MKARSFLILGKGYTGSVLAEKLAEEVPSAEVFATHRKASDTDISFELQHADHWSELPEVDGTFWLFPAEPLESVEAFLSAAGSKLGRIVVLGSTGSFLVSEEDGLIVENSPLDLGEERVKGEEKIVQHGGIVLRSAGIYGPGRNPVEWLREGKAGRSEKLVNFIHVEDLASLLIAAMLKGVPSSRYLAADGQPYRWNQLISIWQKAYQLKVPKNAKPSRRKSKKVDSAWTLEQLQVDLKYPSMLEGVADLMKENG